MSHALSIPWQSLLFPKTKKRERDVTPFRNGDIVQSVHDERGGMVFMHPGEGYLLFSIDPERGIFLIDEVPKLFTTYRLATRGERRNILREMKPGLTFGQDDPNSYEPLDHHYRNFALKYLVPRVRRA